MSWKYAGVFRFFAACLAILLCTGKIGCLPDLTAGMHASRRLPALPYK